MAVFRIDPLTDERWSEFVARHPRSSVFHDARWLRALWLTYGYKPVVITRSAPGQPLEDAIVFCDVKSWLTPRRLVALPFSDHCEPLTDTDGDSAELFDYLATSDSRKIRYAEIRPLSCFVQRADHPWHQYGEFVHHTLSLEPALDALFQQLHKNCIQRKIRRAEKEGLRCTRGNSEGLLQEFYGLLLRTRRRHRVPPQSLDWYRNLISCMGDRLSIRIAWKDDRATAALLTLRHKDTTVYKYGCSDERLNSLGGMPLLFWMAIQEEKEAGAKSLDLGRSEADNSGLIQFKDRLGATRTPMTYWRCGSAVADHYRLFHVARKLVPLLPSAVLHLPRSILAASGSFFYRHMH
jgi:hypothetical protein